MDFVDAVTEAGIAVQSGSSLVYEYGGGTYLISVAAFDVSGVNDE